MKGREKRFADEAENILTYLALAENWQPEWLSRDWPKEVSAANRIPLHEFDGAWSLLSNTDEGEPIFAVSESAGSDGLLDPLELIDALGMSADISFINSNPKTVTESARHMWYSGSPARFLLRRIRRMSIREARPLGLQMKTGILFEDASALVFADGKYDSTREVCEVRGRDIYTIGVPYGLGALHFEGGVKPAADRHESPLNIFVPLSLALTREYNWEVQIRAHPSTPSMSVNASPDSIKSLYKSRDRAPSGRREALRHWVQTHKRKSTSSDEELIDILAYLRGASRFNWNGYECSIRVSDYDLRRAERLNHEREELRALREAKRAQRSRLQDMRASVRRKKSRR